MSESLCYPDQSSATTPDALPSSQSHRQVLKSFVIAAGALAAIPLLIPYALTTKRTLIRQDVQAWRRTLKLRQGSVLLGLLQPLGHYPEFRTLYYHRLRYSNLVAAALSVCFRFFYPGQTALHLRCPDISSGLFLQHAFSTTVGAERIGRNCWINQQVTIGYTDATRGPVIATHRPLATCRFAAATSALGTWLSPSQAQAHCAFTPTSVLPLQHPLIWTKDKDLLWPSQCLVRLRQWARVVRCGTAPIRLSDPSGTSGR